MVTGRIHQAITEQFFPFLRVISEHLLNTGHLDHDAVKIILVNVASRVTEGRLAVAFSKCYVDYDKLCMVKSHGENSLFTLVSNVVTSLIDAGPITFLSLDQLTPLRFSEPAMRSVRRVWIEILNPDQLCQLLLHLTRRFRSELEPKLRPHLMNLAVLMNRIDVTIEERITIFHRALQFDSERTQHDCYSFEGEQIRFLLSETAQDSNISELLDRLLDHTYCDLRSQIFEHIQIDAMFDFLQTGADNIDSLLPDSPFFLPLISKLFGPLPDDCDYVRICAYAVGRHVAEQRVEKANRFLTPSIKALISGLEARELKPRYVRKVLAKTFRKIVRRQWRYGDVTNNAIVPEEEVRKWNVALTDEIARRVAESVASLLQSSTDPVSGEVLNPDGRWALKQPLNTGRFISEFAPAAIIEQRIEQSFSDALRRELLEHLSYVIHDLPLDLHHQQSSQIVHDSVKELDFTGSWHFSADYSQAKEQVDDHLSALSEHLLDRRHKAAFRQAIKDAIARLPSDADQCEAAATVMIEDLVPDAKFFVALNEDYDGYMSWLLYQQGRN
jgi:hypothetical protein